MTNPRESSAVEVEVRVKASQQTVFQLLTDPAKYHLWMGSNATLDARPGGTYRVVFNERDVAKGEYLEVVPNRRVVFTWGWEEADNPIRPGTSTVEIDLVPDGGETIVRLRHNGLPEAANDIHRQGWVLYLDRLAIAGPGGNPGPDPNMRPRNM